MSETNKVPIEFGAVYYRRSAPEEYDWERDYKIASEDGMTQFRHWFLWSAIETAPGVFNWEPYDRQVQLAAKYGIKTIIAEMCDFAPEWFYEQYPEARRENVKGEKHRNNINDSCIAGGNHTMCLDHPAVQEGVTRFLTALGEHYKDMPGVYGYDVWNECSLYTPDLVCYCPSTEIAFRKWLKGKYGDLAALNQAWFRYSFTDWNQVKLPRRNGPHPEFFDAIKFQNDNQEKWLRYRVDTLRKADPNHKLIAHGNAKAHSDIATCCGDDWRYSKDVDIFGYTLYFNNNCHTMMGADMIRSASGEKEFWRAEAVGDSTWEYRSDKTAYEAGKDTMSVPENIRLDAMMSLVTGATGFINPRYRPLVDGHLFHAYGWYGTDGSRTERSEMVSQLASWSNDPNKLSLWEARPVKGEVGILLLEDAQALCYALFGNTEIYASCIKGAYNAFIDSSIQADVIKMHQIGDYDLLYVPYPVGVSDEAAAALKNWVEQGGTLISEGCFGYFNDKGHAIEQQQPNRGFDTVFGCKQNKVHMGPDRNQKIIIHSDKGDIQAGVYQQSFSLTTAEAIGYYNNNEIAAVSNKYGQGNTVLMGSMVGYGYFNRPDEPTRRWFASLLSSARKTARVKTVYNTGITARVWESKDHVYLWLINFTEYDQTVEVELSDEVAEDVLLRGIDYKKLDKHNLRVRVQNRDAAVLQIK